MLARKAPMPPPSVLLLLGALLAWQAPRAAAQPVSMASAGTSKPWGPTMSLDSTGAGMGSASTAGAQTFHVAVHRTKPGVLFVTATSQHALFRYTFNAASFSGGIDVTPLVSQLMLGRNATTGPGYGGDGGLASGLTSQARLSSPTASTVDSKGNLFILGECR